MGVHPHNAFKDEFFGVSVTKLQNFMDALNGDAEAVNGLWAREGHEQEGVGVPLVGRQKFYCGKDGGRWLEHVASVPQQREGVQQDSRSPRQHKVNDAIVLEAQIAILLEIL